MLCFLLNNEVLPVHIFGAVCPVGIAETDHKHDTGELQGRPAQALSPVPQEG